MNTLNRIQSWWKQCDKISWVCVFIGLVTLAMGWWYTSYALFGAGAASLCYWLLRVSGWKPPQQRPANVTLTVASHDRLPEDTPNDARTLVDQLLAQGRSALLLRPEIVANLTEDQQKRAYEALYDEMSLVPDGEVFIVGGLVFPSDEHNDEETATRGTVVRVERFFVDRYQVTNEQFKQFVDAGGYEQMAIWDPEIWPGVMDFVDLSGLPGPRYWENGTYSPGTQDHPVVGVSWYEASAFARWVGKRLATDPEWEKAASWPTQLSANKRPGRKYPWGEIMDRRRCNLWGNGPNSTASVFEFEDGVSVGGAFQLIGNVWEWTTANFGAWCCPSQDVILPSPMKSIRGGAFDTYFDNQATCQFRSGEDPISRKHNVGFRCALSLCDLALTQAAASSDDEADSQPTSSPRNSERDGELAHAAVETEEAALSCQAAVGQTFADNLHPAETEASI